MEYQKVGITTKIVCGIEGGRGSWLVFRFFVLRELGVGVVVCFDCCYEGCGRFVVVSEGRKCV